MGARCFSAHKIAGELPPEVQVKLLRAIQHGEIEPIGAGRAEKVNVRVVSATNRRLLNLAKDGAFREDLYYRLNVFPIYVPPLRDRPEDIGPLVSHFISRLAAEASRRVIGISDPALALLRGYNWPGNIRQLENAVYRAIVLSDSAYLEVADFPQIVAQTAGRADAAKLTNPCRRLQPRFISMPLSQHDVQQTQGRPFRIDLSTPTAKSPRCRRWSASSSSLPCGTMATACRGSPGRSASAARRSIASCGNTASKRMSSETRPEAGRCPGATEPTHKIARNCRL